VFNALQRYSMCLDQHSVADSMDANIELKNATIITDYLLRRKIR
jgi:hypothetical protein